jgi:hypothetical protein
MPMNMDSWYYKFKYYLQCKSSVKILDAKITRVLRLKYTHYNVINGVVFGENYDSLLHRCLEISNDERVLNCLHEKIGIGHFSRYTTTHKIMNVIYCRPTLFKDAHKCHIF